MRVAVVGVLADSMVRFRGDMLRSMVAHGHEVLAIAPEDDPSVRAALREIGVDYATVPLRRAGMNPLRDAWALISLARTFRRFRADAVLTYAAKPVIYGSIAARLVRVPVRAALITGVGSVFNSGPGTPRRLISSVLIGLYRVALRGTHVVLFQNPDDERLFRSKGLVGDRQQVVRVNGSGVELERFSTAPMPPPPVTFLMLSRLLREKGVFEYSEAARLVRLAHPDVRIQLLGALDPNPSGITPQELESVRADDAVAYLGSTPDVRPFLAAAHVCVLPSYYGEGVPRSILEAMAMGRAVVTTDVPGCRETVVHGRNGLLVPPRDAKRLAEAMLELLRDPARIERMGRESRALAEERFDVHDVNRTILRAMHLS